MEMSEARELVKTAEQRGLRISSAPCTLLGETAQTLWKALRELCGLGLIDQYEHCLPRLVAVQSENCAPVVAALERGLERVEPVVSKGTIAEGLDVPAAIMGHAILRSLRESDGTAVSVSEAAIERDFQTMGGFGIVAGYESAAPLSALRLLRAGGAVSAGTRVLLLVTGGPVATLGGAPRQ